MLFIVIAAILLPGSMQRPDSVPCPVVCSYLIKPVCGSNGVTYDNPCLLRAAKCSDVNIKLQSNGPCESDVPQNDCVSEKAPGVCRGMFQRWFYDADDNSCKMFTYGGCGGNGNNYNTKKDCENTCQHINGYLGCPESCPNTREPVCGSDSETYANFCQLQRAIGCENKDIFEQHQGECTMSDYGGKGYIGCPSTCPNTFAPVCASNGDDYDNFCHFQVAVGCWGEDIFVTHEGRCDENEKK